LSSDGNVSSLNFLDNTSTDVTFSVAYFRFLPPLLADTDENYLTREFEDMVQAKSSTLHFSTINDPQAARNWRHTKLRSVARSRLTRVNVFKVNSSEWAAKILWQVNLVQILMRPSRVIQTWSKKAHSGFVTSRRESRRLSACVSIWRPVNS
jgi:hypothetical protein